MEAAWARAGIGPIRHQAIAGNPMVVLTDGRHLAEVREALAVAGRLDDLRVVWHGRVGDGIPVEAWSRRAQAGSLLSRHATPDAGGMTGSMPAHDPVEAAGPTRATVVVAETEWGGLAYARDLVAIAVRAARAEGRPEPALITAPPSLSFRDAVPGDMAAAGLTHQRPVTCARDDLVTYGTLRWALDATAHGDLAAAWDEALAIHDGLHPARSLPGMLVLEDRGRTVVAAYGSVFTGELDRVGLWEIQPSGLCRAYTVSGDIDDFSRLDELARAVLRGGIAAVAPRGCRRGNGRVPATGRPYPLLTPDKALAVAERSAGMTGPGTPSGRIDPWLTKLARDRPRGESIAGAVVRDPARQRARGDFARTWPALAEALLVERWDAEIASGRETLPVVAKMLESTPAVARRLVGLERLPDSRVADSGGDTGSVGSVGRYLAAVGHDRLPAVGDGPGWHAFAAVSAWMAAIVDASPMRSIDAATAARLTVAIPGRNWPARLARLADMGAPADVIDVARSLSAWLSVASGTVIGTARATRVLLGHASLLGLAEASMAWHAHPLLLADVRGLPMDTAWPVPFATFHLGMGLEARCLATVADLVAEGVDGLDPRGVPGLGHCVGGYGLRCQTGESLVVSIRETGGGARLSTAELVPDPVGRWRIAGRSYRLAQHKGRRNGAPSGQAAESLDFLREALGSGGVPVSEAALEPRPPVETHADARHATCLHGAWRRLLPRRLARLDLDGLVACVTDVYDGDRPGHGTGVAG